MRSAFQATVSGRVQMVMYRDFVLRQARTLDIVGEVKNVDNGIVCVVAEGERSKLEKLIEKLKKGPSLAQVETVMVDWVAPTGAYSNFTITYD